MNRALLLVLLVSGCSVRHAPQTAAEATELWKPDYPDCEFIADEFDNLAVKCPGRGEVTINVEGHGKVTAREGESAGIYSFGDETHWCSGLATPDTRACNPWKQPE